MAVRGAAVALVARAPAPVATVALAAAVALIFGTQAALPVWVVDQALELAVGPALAQQEELVRALALVAASGADQAPEVA